MFVINLKAPSGSRISVTEAEVAKVEALIRQVVPAEDLRTDSVQHRDDAGLLVDIHQQFRSAHSLHPGALKDEHKGGSYEYMARVKRRIAEQMPELSTYFQSGGLVDAVLNLGLPAPIDVQVAGSNMERSHKTAVELAAEIQKIPGVADVYIPQDIDYPALKLDVDRTRASELGLDQQEVVGNVITALTSNQMIAPSYLGRSEVRPGLHAHGAVHRRPGQVACRSESHSCAGCGKSAADSTRCDQFDQARHSRRRKSIITRSAA